MRKLSFVLAFAAGVVLVTTATAPGCGLSGGGDPSDEIRIEGLSTEDIVDAGISLEVPVEEPAFDAKHAAEVALEKRPGARIRQVVLAGVRGKGLVWVVNFEQDSIVPEPPSGGGFLSTDPKDITVKFALVFVDATTGEWLHSLEEATSILVKD